VHISLVDPSSYDSRTHPIPKCKPDRCVSGFERRGSTLPLPYIPGTDVCGEVEAAGAGVGHVKKGDRIWPLGGGYAEETCLLASEAIAARELFVAERFAAGCLDAFRSGVLKPVPDCTFPFDRIADAHAYMLSDAQVGKIVLTID
jgi:NADPH:quinone reductase-like Zn-dependent oxidoreductase